MTKPQSAPRWDVSNVFPGLESPELEAAFTQLRAQIAALQARMDAELPQVDEHTPAPRLAALLSELVDGLNQIFDLGGTLESYLVAFVSTDSYNSLAQRRYSEYEQTWVPAQMLEMRLRALAGKVEARLDAVNAQPDSASAHAFYLRDAAAQSRYQMSEAEETLAAELALSGGNAWGRLQGVVTSQMSVPFELDGQEQKLPMPALINLRSHPDGDVRRRAYEAEMAAWEGAREPLAAALNGVKGTADTLNRRRGRKNAVHSALDEARIDQPTLDAMLGAMRDSFPMFRQYFQAKARKLGKEKLPWWDLFAPMGQNTQSFTYDAARSYILEQFRGFSPHLEAFAQHAFEKNWIDAEQRSGKQGGAFCMSLPLQKESRILCNFDGSFDQVSTIAHELGHGFHDDCLFRAGKTNLQRRTPMTLAETASILCETIIMEAAYAEARDDGQKLAILDSALINDSQLIVDISSRYLFEQALFERRAQSELSADEICELMRQAQLQTYGDGLDERYLHPYMWTWKPHYYSVGLSFYNFPYAFGLLFGLGLYAEYRARGAEFVPDYMRLLASTGEGTAAELGARFGLDLTQADFWRKSLRVVEERIRQYQAL